MSINTATNYGGSTLPVTANENPVNQSIGTTFNTSSDAVITGTSSVNEKADGVKKDLTKAEVEKMANSLNKFMESLDVDIQFKLHEKTKRLMVQVVDPNDNNKVIKEFPPHELLDTMAKISEYVGVLLDKKA